MSNAKVSHLPPNITAKDHEKQFPGMLHESGGKLFCTACNTVVEHKRKSSIDKHFATAKHTRRMAEVQGAHLCACTAVNIPLSKSDHPALRKFLTEKVMNGGAIPGFHQFQEKYLSAVYLNEKESLNTHLAKKPVAVIFDETPDIEGRCVLNILIAPLEKDESGRILAYLSDTVFLDELTLTFVFLLLLATAKRSTGNDWASLGGQSFYRRACYSHRDWAVCPPDPSGCT
ncbi:CGG triplet repeat-binding protein 1-like [Alosa pseudoharengus]|uniref:CGG triplet repeat-binding protein 1-like n=1 Tax=Alosa pseudoharengus TaxID=34774 RepID=UPI003F8AE1F9